MNRTTTSDDDSIVTTSAPYQTESNDAYPDTLCLKIIEYDEQQRMDTTLYIIYDAVNDTYLIRGSRGTRNKLVYSFVCDQFKQMIDFIDFVFEKTNTFSFIMVNYNNLPDSVDDITFDFLDANSKHEIAGYDDCPFCRKKIVGYLKLLKHVY